MEGYNKNIMITEKVNADVQRRQLLKSLIMKNEQEMLDLFKVEELEKRYEMGKWSVGGSASSGTGSGLTVKVTATYTF